MLDFLSDNFVIGWNYEKVFTGYLGVRLVSPLYLSEAIVTGLGLLITWISLSGDMSSYIWLKRARTRVVMDRFKLIQLVT